METAHRMCRKSIILDFLIATTPDVNKSFVVFEPEARSVD